jgi:methyl-accepting chemotaxis protein
MELDEQIQAAIGAHGLWKSVLKASIASGTSEMPADVVRDDHHCSFGKWLHGPEIDAQAKKSSHYRKCTELHRRFHIAAAEIVSLAIAGKKQDASNALGEGQDFAKVSHELTRELMAWKSD